MDTAIQVQILDKIVCVFHFVPMPFGKAMNPFILPSAMGK